MSTLNFLQGSFPSSATPRFVAPGVSYFSSSLRMVPALSHKNPEVIVVNWEKSRNPQHEFGRMAEINMVVRHAERQIPPVPHWRFCYMTLRNNFNLGALILHQFDIDLRNAVCVLYLSLYALDHIEDDTSISAEVKVPTLMAFHRLIYDQDLQFARGTKNYRVLLNNFYHVSTAFMDLGLSYQEVIEDTTKKMGAGMSKFICKEIETIDDYDEYCHYVSGLVGLGLSKLFHASGIEDLPPGTFFHTSFVFGQKADIIQDYLEDINMTPKPRRFWPRQIWNKYTVRLEDFKYEKNSIQALHCLNDMVTNALLHAEDCLKDISAVQDPVILRSIAGVQIDDSDPNANKTRDRVESILKTLEGLQNFKTEVHNQE
ncbi:squalene synthase-like isoform X2 [Olea europaea var. sylvestris]|uniref:squalene synthase-like isoform X2 n=1 Tax=Olea europaea var. sylvestris TaxID=158386 RepID=UPI000C1CDC3C|nr:squalene synthase-like isoform X2 [Olea europaea var. sylvestris]